MILRYRPIVVWPGAFTSSRKPSPFEASWTDTQELLERELRAIGAVLDTVVLQVALRESDLRLDGQPRANARPADHPGVILSFETRRKGTLSFPCDTFDKRHYRSKLEGWQANVRAIALGLEALRKVERYGIANTGQQYTGWRQIGAGSPMPAATMTVEGAARFIAEQAGDINWWNDALDDTAGMRKVLYRDAARRLHPDAGGDPALFRRLNEALDLLERHG